MISSYRDLDVWRRSMDLVEHCYRATASFPRAEEFGLRAQLRRACVSVPSNIAERHGRSTTGEYLQHLSVAHGSLMEVETQLQISGRLGYLEPGAVTALLGETGQIGKMIHTIGSRLRTRVTGRNRGVPPAVAAPNKRMP